MIKHPIFEYSDLAFTRRGTIINDTINLEKLIDGYLSAHYCDPQGAKRDEFENILLSQLQFSQKLQVFYYIIDNHDIELPQRWPHIKRDLEEIREVRNKMAHSWLDVTITFVGNRHNLKAGESKFIDKKNRLIELDEVEFNRITNLIKHYIVVLMSWYH